MTPISPGRRVPASDPESDAERIVRLIQDGDQAGREQLYEMLHRGVRFLLRRSLGDEGLDDSTHDVFLIVTQAIQRGELRDPGALLGYMRGVVRFQCATQLKRRIRDRSRCASIDEAEAVADSRRTPEEQVARLQKLEVMHRVLDELSERDREILVRFYLQEQEPGQIMGEMGLTENQFRLAKSRAKTRLGKLGKLALIKSVGSETCVVP